MAATHAATHVGRAASPTALSRGPGVCDTFVVTGDCRRGTPAKPPSQPAAAAPARQTCPMLNRELKQYVISHMLPRVQMPGQYLGGELNMVVKDHRQVRGRVCLAFPDAYTIGMSHHGLQVLYTLMNAHRRLGLRTGLCPLARHGGAAPGGRPAALQPGDLHAAVASSTCWASRCSTKSAPATCWRCSTWAGFRSARRADDGRSAGDRRRAVRAEPRAAGAVHRSVRHRRRRAEPAGDLPALAGAAGKLPAGGGYLRARPAGASARKCWPDWRPSCHMFMSRGFTSRSMTPTAGWWRIDPTRGDVPATIEPCGDRRPGWHAAADCCRWCRSSSASTIGSRSRSCAAAPGSAAFAKAR